MIRKLFVGWESEASRLHLANKNPKPPENYKKPEVIARWRAQKSLEMNEEAASTAILATVSRVKLMSEGSEWPVIDARVAGQRDLLVRELEKWLCPNDPNLQSGDHGVIFGLGVWEFAELLAYDLLFSGRKFDNSPWMSAILQPASSASHVVFLRDPLGWFCRGELAKVVDRDAALSELMVSANFVQPRTAEEAARMTALLVNRFGF